MKKVLLLCIGLSNWMLCATYSAPLGTAFTYQGRLSDGGSPANGIYDLRFTIYDSATNGTALAGPITNSPTSVSNGLFTVTLDFGTGAFDGNARWLEIGVRTNGDTGAFTPLNPRQPLTPSPYALFAPNAAIATTANGVAASTVSAAQLNTPDAPASGQVLAYNGGGLVWTNATSAAAAWSLNGNAGTAPGVNFLGTTDNQPLELRVSNQRGLRLEPGVSNSVNVVLGWIGNGVALGVVGATVGGGGAGDYFATSYTNWVGADFGTVSGGGANTIQTNAFYATIGGGLNNTIQSNVNFATIAGGTGNKIQVHAHAGTISGGINNTVQTNSNNATIGGGIGNTVQTNASDVTIGGGNANSIQTYANGATISGGILNRIRTGAGDGTIGGGAGNVLEANVSYGTIGGGIGNTIQSDAPGATIGGGNSNTIQTNGSFAIIPGGRENTATNYAFAAGHRAKANHTGAFVWSDSNDVDFVSVITNEFAVRATGGVRFVSGVDSNGVPVAGVSLPAGSGSWSSLSDRNAKENFNPADSREILERVAALPIQTWNYKSQDASVRHIGPMAQDFHAAFHVGEDDRHVATVDADGVALAAIQALNQKLEETRAENAELKRTVIELKDLVKAMDAKLNGGTK